MDKSSARWASQVGKANNARRRPSIRCSRGKRPLPRDETEIKNFAIGRILHLKSEIQNLKSDTGSPRAFNLRFRTWDLRPGFVQCRTARPGVLTPEETTIQSTRRLRNG